MDFGAFSVENLASRDSQTVILLAQASQPWLIITLRLCICMPCRPHWSVSIAM